MYTRSKTITVFYGEIVDGKEVDDLSEALDKKIEAFLGSDEIRTWHYKILSHKIVPLPETKKREAGLLWQILLTHDM